MRVINKQRRPADHIRRDRLIKITKRAEKAARRQVLDELCSKIVNEKNRSDNGRIPYGLVSRLVKETTPVCSWINRNVIINHYRSISKKSPTTSSPPPLQAPL